MAFRVLHANLAADNSLSVKIDAGIKIIAAQEVSLFREAEQIIDEAHLQADAILSGANDAYEAERKRGYTDGRQEALMEQAEQMIEHVSRTVDYFSRIESRMVDLVMSAVRKIVADFDEGERVLIVVKNALSVVRNQKQMTLRLSPSQVEGVRERVNELLATYPGVGYLDIVSDGRVKLDACILESEIGLVEASVETQLDAIQAAFAKILGSRT